MLKGNHGIMEIVREALNINVRFRLGSALLDIEDSTNRHLGWPSYVSRACHALPRAKRNTGCVEIR